MSANRRFSIVVASVLLMLPSVAAAQTAQVPLPVAVGQRIRITSADGTKTAGKVVSLEPAAVEIAAPSGELTSVAASDVTRIQIQDSVTNGVLTGALTFGLIGMTYGAAGDATGDILDVLFTGEARHSTNYGQTFGFTGLVVGAVLGYAIDAARERTVYMRSAAGPTVTLRPIASNAGKGIGVRVRW